jgi:hypothetical protein
MKGLLNGQKIDINLSGLRGTDFPDDIAKDQKMLDSIQ